MEAMAAWADLQAELDRWAAVGRVADLWWRDDDAIAVTPALDRLFGLHHRFGAPLALAVIPARAQPGLAERLATLPGIAALQHGFAHQNHASAPAKKSELPAERPLLQRLDDLRAGDSRMKDMFGSSLLPVLVPPWNRMADDLLPALSALGFIAVSGFKSRPGYWAGENLAWLNTHVDPIDWHGGNAAIGAAWALHAACAMLRAMRLGELPLQPLGLLTHHLRHDEAIWDFIARFLEITRHPAARWVDTATALGVGRPANVIPPS